MMHRRNRDFLPGILSGHLVAIDRTYADICGQCLGWVNVHYRTAIAGAVAWYLFLVVANLTDFRKKAFGSVAMVRLLTSLLPPVELLVTVRMERTALHSCTNRTKHSGFLM